MSWYIKCASLLCLVWAVRFTLIQAASSRPDHIKLTLGEETSTQEVPCLQWLYYTVEITKSCMDLKIEVNHQGGEPNVYVSRGATKYPTETSLAWSSYNWGSDYLTISSWDPEFAIGTFYIGVHAYCGDDVGTRDTAAQFKILVDSVPTTHPRTEIPMNRKVTDQLEANSYDYFIFCIPDSCVNVEVKLENCIDPEACPSTYTWPELLVSRSIVTPTINDHAWKLASIETRSVVLKHDDPEFFPGHYFVGVYGWCTPAEHCNDPSTCGPCDNYQADYNVSLVVNEISSGCKPKKPLSLCEGGATSNTASVIVLVLSALFAGLNLCV